MKYRNVFMFDSDATHYQHLRQEWMNVCNKNAGRLQLNTIMCDVHVPRSHVYVYPVYCRPVKNIFLSLIEFLVTIAMIRAVLYPCLCNCLV